MATISPPGASLAPACHPPTHRVGPETQGQTTLTCATRHAYDDRPDPRRGGAGCIRSTHDGKKVAAEELSPTFKSIPK